jgi:hypothetical protein
MEHKFATWDDIFNGDYPDQRLANMVTVGDAIDKYNYELESNIN